MSGIGDLIRKIPRYVFRNQYCMNGEKAIPHTVNIEYFPLCNIGDSLGPVVVKWMLDRRKIDPAKRIAGTKHLLSIGSVIYYTPFDATVWGSGAITTQAASLMRRNRILFDRKLDVRAVRGPVTRSILMEAGYPPCPEIYGDPAILMPLIFESSAETQYDVSLVLHYRSSVGKPETGKYHLDLDPVMKRHDIHIIDPKTTDYAGFINELCASKRVISSSLHGLILAEAYGIPSTFLNWGISDEIDKFEDWYRSTGRALQYSPTLEEALDSDLTPVPDLTEMQRGLMDCFPYDLWEE